VILVQIKAVSIWAFSKPATRKHKNGNNQMVATGTINQQHKSSNLPAA